MEKTFVEVAEEETCVESLGIAMRVARKEPRTVTMRSEAREYPFSSEIGAE